MPRLPHKLFTFQNRKPVRRSQRPRVLQKNRTPRRTGRSRPHRKPRNMLWLGTALALILVGLCLLAVGIGFSWVYGPEHILPGVRAVGVDVGRMTEAEAAQMLTTVWHEQGILLRDSTRTWSVSSAELGITLDATATAQIASEWGRAQGGMTGVWQSITHGVDIEPVLIVDLAQFARYLKDTGVYFDLPAVNAGIQLIDGQAVASPASEGRTLDITATLDVMRVNAAAELSDGVLDLVMITTYPAISDAAPLVAQANTLLASPFTLKAYDPIRDEWHHWAAPPEVWTTWLKVNTAPESPLGLALVMNTAGPTAFLATQGHFADERYLEIETAIQAMQTALAQNQTEATLRIWHHSTSYTVQARQTLASIAEDVGIPYPYIQAANPHINPDALNAGQSLELPSLDILVPLALVPHKRIIISRSQQHLWAYENGQVVFDWVISTGLPSSPTALGVFQVQSHDVNAYADQWNLYMPHFIGFYHPGPQMALMNGFHGFPTRGGGYLLWSDDLGHPVTYGCVLLSLENAELLYNWAEVGVIVEVRA